MAARWRSSYAVKLAVWWLGYFALLQMLPGSQSGWELVGIFLGAVLVTTIVMTLVSDGPGALLRVVRPSPGRSEAN